MGELRDRYGADWAGTLERRMKELIRNEIRFRHRLAANEEIARLVLAAEERFHDLVTWGVAPRFNSFAEIEEVLALSRRELHQAVAPDASIEVMNTYEGLTAKEPEPAIEWATEDGGLPSPRSSAKHDPQVYVELAQQGLSNVEIAKALGNVTESSVRRGLKKANYMRRAA